MSQETGSLLDPTILTEDKALNIPLEPGEGRLFLLIRKGLVYRPPAEIYGGKELELPTRRGNWGMT